VTINFGLFAMEQTNTSAAVWIQTVTQGGAGAALIFFVKKVADGTLVWRDTAEMLDRATVALEEANERGDVYHEFVKSRMNRSDEA